MRRTIKKAQKGIKKYSKEEFAAKKFRNLDGSLYSKDPDRKVTYTSEDKNYVIKDKYTDGIRTSSKERRTLKGFLGGAPKAAGKTPLDAKGNFAQKNGGVTKAKGGKWIQKAIKKPGALRAQLGAKPGQPIPAGKLAAAAKKPGKLGQRARLAQTLKKMKKK